MCAPDSGILVHGYNSLYMITLWLMRQSGFYVSEFLVTINAL